MAPTGYLHDDMDVKVLILFILARIDTPLTVQEVYEVAYQDDSLNYFTFADSISRLADTGHVSADQKGRYTITDKGRQQGQYVEDSLAVPVVIKVSMAIERKKADLRRDGYLTTSVQQDEAGFWTVTLNYKDDGMPMMTLTLMAPNEELGNVMAANMKKQAELIYQTNLETAINSPKKQVDRP